MSIQSIVNVIEMQRFTKLKDEIAQKIPALDYDCERDDLKVYMAVLNTLEQVQVVTPWTAAKNAFGALRESGLHDEDMINWLAETIKRINDGDLLEEVTTLQLNLVELTERVASIERRLPEY